MIKTCNKEVLRINNIVKNKNSNFIIVNKEKINKISIHLCNNTIISKLKKYGFYHIYLKNHF